MTIYLEFTSVCKFTLSKQIWDSFSIENESKEPPLLANDELPKEAG